MGQGWTRSRERQDKHKGLAKLLEPGNNIPAGWARAGGWHPFRQLLPERLLCFRGRPCPAEPPLHLSPGRSMAERGLSLR